MKLLIRSRGASGGPNDAALVPVQTLFERASWSNTDPEGSLRRIAAAVRNADGLRRLYVRREAIRRLTRAKAPRPIESVKAAFDDSESSDFTPENTYGSCHPNGSKKRCTFWIAEYQAEALSQVKQRDGIGVSEQIRRAIDAWVSVRTAM